MRSRQRKTYKAREENHANVESPLPHQCLDRSRSKYAGLVQSPVDGKRGNVQTDQIQSLLRENSELKRQIVQLKVHQFYHFDDSKLKQMIQQVDQLRKQVKKTKQQLMQLQMQNDFLTRTNTHLKEALEKEIQQRKKDSLAQEGRLLNSSKVNDHTRNTDCSRNTEDQISHLSYHQSNMNFFQNTTLEEALGCREVLKGTELAKETDYQIIEQSQRGTSRHPRKSLMQKILSPRRGKERAGSGETNQYLLCRRGKEKSTYLS